jgi:hypothetical protein
MNYKKKVFLSITLLLILVFAGCDNGKKSTGTPLPNVPETYSLKIDIIGEGNVKKTPDKEVYEKNDMVTLKAIPAEDHDFAFWEGAIRSTEPERVIIMEKDIHLKANFGLILGHADFNDDDPGEEYDHMRWVIEDGKLSFTVNAGFLGQLPITDIGFLPESFYGETDIEFDDTDFYQGVGLTFNLISEDAKSFHYFKIMKNGYYYIRKAIPEGGMFKLTTLKTGQVPGFKRNEANKLAFSLKDSVFTFYINGSYVDYIELEDIIPVFFLILTSPDNDTTAYFDNLKLLSLDPQIEPINLDIVSQNKNLPEAMKIIDIRNE